MELAVDCIGRRVYEHIFCLFFMEFVVKLND